MPPPKEKIMNQEIVRTTMQKLLEGMSHQEIIDRMMFPLSIDTLQGLLDGRIPYTAQAVMFLSSTAIHVDVSGISGQPKIQLSKDKEELISILHKEVKAANGGKPMGIEALTKMMMQPLVDNSKLN
jgi:hypothetical protein